MSRRHQVHTIGHKSVQLFKDQTIGIGAYGKVCKAKCDNLTCAAKLIHETLLDPMAHFQLAPQREHSQPMKRFQQECEFLRTIRHPNIILYLGMHRDGDTGLPVLLMELMDDSLTHFLESSTKPVPYQTKSTSATILPRLSHFSTPTRLCIETSPATMCFYMAMS